MILCMFLVHNGGRYMLAYWRCIPGKRWLILNLAVILNLRDGVRRWLGLTGTSIIIPLATVYLNTLQYIHGCL